MIYICHELGKIETKVIYAIIDCIILLIVKLGAYNFLYQISVRSQLIVVLFYTLSYNDISLLENQLVHQN